MNESSGDGEPHLSAERIDTGEFFFPGGGVSALLIHGLTGTPHEMRYLGERLAAAGVRVRGVKLAGHAGTPQELAATGYNNWYESVVQGFEELRRFGDPNVVIGLSLGATLAARLAIDQRADVAGIAMLSSAFFLDRWTTMALWAARLLGPFVRRLYLSSSGSDIHDDHARTVHPSTRLMPLSAPIGLLELSAIVRRRLKTLTQPALIIHSHNDHVCPYGRNVEFLMTRLGGAHKLVELQESYHVITVDTDRERVASEVIEFVGQFRATSPQRAAI
jgi:carboxylesterase